MRRERFMEILSVQEEMRDRQIAEFVLLRLEETDKKDVSDRLSRLIRTADVIGEGSDGRLYLLLTQVNLESFHFVESRLISAGIHYYVTEKVGE